MDCREKFRPLDFGFTETSLSFTNWSPRLIHYFRFDDLVLALQPQKVLRINRKVPTSKYITDTGIIFDDECASFMKRRFPWQYCQE
mmetsp:Transcript_2366/g.5494  ORF Transcript_2366/g.5494 Transcript_2366/m.5494 type:complete len:86 (+) Transcript_2366:1008-1265(+)